MSPVNMPDSFWSHVPQWMWPIIISGLVGFFIYQALKASESFANIFGKIGRRIYARATLDRRLELRLDQIQSVLDTTADNLQCATAYLVVVDTPWHLEADVIIAHAAPHVTELLPPRVSYLDFSKRWRAGWRPEQYRDE